MKLNSNDGLKILDMIEKFEDLDDVQDVYSNFDIEEKELEALLSE